MVSAPKAAAKVSWPELEGAEAEAGLQHQRQQERQRADARSGTGSRRSPRRGRSAPAAGAGRPPDGRPGRRAGRRAGCRPRRRRAEPGVAQPGTMPRPMVSKPNMRPTRPTEVRREARPVSNGGGRASRSGRDEQRDQHQAQHRDRDVDPEDPAPVEVGGDEPAEQRPDHRPDQRRHGQPGHGAHQLGLGHRAQQDQPARPAPSSPRPGPGACARPPSAGSELLSPHRIEPSQEHDDRARGTRCARRNRSATQPLIGMNTARLNR